LAFFGHVVPFKFMDQALVAGMVTDGHNTLKFTALACGTRNWTGDFIHEQ
jgi:hypothetical protein